MENTYLLQIKIRSIDSTHVNMEVTSYMMRYNSNYFID
jgi:hypothetical protein